MYQLMEVGLGSASFVTHSNVVSDIFGYKGAIGKGSGWSDIAS